jgi:putative SOS response-associated peptidase YedK
VRPIRPPALCPRPIRGGHGRPLARLASAAAAQHRPMSAAPVLRAEVGERVLEVFRWELIPSWAKDPAIAAKCFNARGETIHQKPAFRSAFRRRRCLVPVPGFYEWQKVPEQSRKQPCWIHPRQPAR